MEHEEKEFCILDFWHRGRHPVWVHISGKAVGAVLLSIAGALVLGVGMCMTMIWNMLVPGIVMGAAGILLLLCLIPLVKGLK